MLGKYVVLIVIGYYEVGVFDFVYDNCIIILEERNILNMKKIVTILICIFISSLTVHDVAKSKAHDEAVARIKADIESGKLQVVTWEEYISGQSSSSSTPAHTHNYEQTATKEATCSEEGVMTYTCSGCGDSYTKPIPKTEHTWNETITKPATCTEEGIKHKVCTVCGYEEDETIPIDPDAHDYEEVITKEPTCTEDGVAKKVCKNCGAETELYTIPATGHDYKEEVTKEPTCTEPGIKTFTCRNCGDSYTEEIPALGHDEPSEYVYKAKIGNLIFDGKTVYTCSRCGEVREEADPNTYPIVWLYVSVILLIFVAIGIVVVLKVLTGKKNEQE